MIVQYNPIGTIEIVLKVIIKIMRNNFRIGEKVSKASILFEFYEFLKERKKWWLAPIIIFLVLFGTLIVLTEGSALAPFIYTLF